MEFLGKSYTVEEELDKVTLSPLLFVLAEGFAVFSQSSTNL
jgi:hypothetical protein